MSMPTGRYFVSNGGMPLVPGQIGKGLIVPINPMSHVAWYLVHAPTKVSAEYPDKHCYILHTDANHHYLAMMHLASPDGEIQTGFNVELPATTTHHQHHAWVFVLDGEISDNTFTGKFVSPDDKRTFGVRPPPPRLIGTMGTPVISPYPGISHSIWTLKPALMGEAQEGS